MDNRLLMKMLEFPIVIIPENGSFSAWSPDLDVASQGDTIEEAIANLKEAMELHIECLSGAEIEELKKRRPHKIMTNVEVALA